MGFFGVPKLFLVPFRNKIRRAGVAQWLERHVANVNVEGSNPFTRFLFAHSARFFRCEHTFLGLKDSSEDAPLFVGICSFLVGVAVCVGLTAALFANLL